MRILLTNDDGIFAPGLAALRRAVEDLGDVYVVAPSSPQSATGHGITLHDTVAVERVEQDGAFWGVSIEGRPADCVKLAVHELVGDVDLVLSGINPGANVGINVLYSGTVAAAAEGAILGARAVAFSQELAGMAPDLDASARYCRAVLDTLLAGDLSPGQLVSVNLPRQEVFPPIGVRIDRQAVAGIYERYAATTGDDGRTLYKLTEEFGFTDPPENTDVVALQQGRISVTPLHVDLTDSDRVPTMRTLTFELPDDE